MFACLCDLSCQQSLFGVVAPERRADADEGPGVCPPAIEVVAREFSPRVEVHRSDLVSLDIAGLGRLLGTPADIAEELQRAAADRGLRIQVAVAPTRTAALLLAVSGGGRRALSAARGRREAGGGGREQAKEPIVVPPGSERDAVAALPLGVLRSFDSLRSLRTSSGLWLPATGERRLAADEVVTLLHRWGLRTLGDLAALPSRPLSERLGQDGIVWQRLARGEDLQPLVAHEPEAPIEERLDLEWPVEGLEPLSFVLARMCEPLSERLAALDLAAVVLRLSCRLVSRDTEVRELQLPAPMRDPKVLRTLLLLHLESHPLTGGVDHLTLRVEAARARVTQFSLLARARPAPERMATLLARLSALLGERRVGAAALVDSYRPGAFVMTDFSGGFDARRAGASPRPGIPPSPGCGEGHRSALRRFRVPVPARVLVKDGRPVRVSMERRGLDGGVVTSAAGPWRTSGEWWKVEGRVAPRQARDDPEWSRRGEGWNRDEWDVALSDGALYRIYRDRTADRWFVDGVVD